MIGQKAVRMLRTIVSQTSSGLGDIGDVDSVLGLSRGQLGDHRKKEETDTAHLDRFSVYMGRWDNFLWLSSDR